VVNIPFASTRHVIIVHRWTSPAGEPPMLSGILEFCKLG